MNIGITELLLIAIIVFVLFGTKKLRGIGGDLGTAIKEFKSAINDDQTHTKSAQIEENKD